MQESRLDAPGNVFWTFFCSLLARAPNLSPRIATQSGHLIFDDHKPLSGSRLLLPERAASIQALMSRSAAAFGHDREHIARGAYFMHHHRLGIPKQKALSYKGVHSPTRASMPCHRRRFPPIFRRQIGHACPSSLREPRSFRSDKCCCLPPCVLLEKDDLKS